MRVFARMEPAGRLRLALEMCDDLRAMVTAGVRHRHPDLDDEQVLSEVARLWLGDTMPSRPT
jgi:hypothetical protein